MTSLYPRERVESVVRTLMLPVAHRILLNRFVIEPLHAYPSPSRFCDGRSFSVLYAASDFATCFIEVVVRDRFVQRSGRVIPYDDIRARAWVEIDLPQSEPLMLVDLRGDGCLTLGAPTDAAHARNQSAGRALGRALFEQHPDVDGIWYQSRFTGGECFAIFDRALPRLAVRRAGELDSHPQLPEILQTHDIGLEL